MKVGDVMSTLTPLLSPLELEFVAPVAQLDATVETELSRGVLICRFSDQNEMRCPFELHFGREQPYGKLVSFFIGSGAEFYSCERLEDRDDAVALGGDLQGFLTSPVRVERVRDRAGIVEERYRVPGILIAGGPLELRYCRAGPNVGETSRDLTELQPWRAAKATG